MKFYLWVSLLLAVLGAALMTGCSDKNQAAFTNPNLREAIVYMAHPVEHQQEVWMMMADGTNKHAVVSLSDRKAIMGSLSPDGTKVLYVTHHSDSRILLRDLATNVDTELYNDTDYDDDFTPIFNPQGTKIALHLNEDSNLYLMNPDGTGLAAFTSGENDDISPAWNATGTKMVFDRGWNGSIYTINANGTGLTLVKSDSENYDYGQPQFLPDGRIVCMRDDDDSKDIVLMNADGSNEINLTPDTVSSDEFFPSVSHDGTKIVFASDRNDKQEIFVGTLSGTTLTNLTNLTASVNTDCWRPQFGMVDISTLSE